MSCPKTACVYVYKVLQDVKMEKEKLGKGKGEVAYSSECKGQ